MSGSPKVWPLLDEYNMAVLNPKRNLKDTRLHLMEVEKQGALGLPRLRSGNFGAVYKFYDQRQVFALKVFSKAEPDRELRYRLVDEHLKSQPDAPNLVSFGYEAQGIKVNGRWYPTLSMDWVAGQPLDSYLTDALKQRDKVDNRSLCQAWVELILSLMHRNVAHGDLQHGNILVLPNRSLRLVDYDGMFVPAMRQRGLRAVESGLAAYQHPKRNPNYFDERLDSFAALVILLSLACVDAGRWKRYHTDDNYLIVREGDLLRPEQSALLTELSNSPDPPVRKLAVMLRTAARRGLDDIPRFDRLVADPTIKQLLAPSWRPTPFKDDGTKKKKEERSDPRIITSGPDQLTARQREILALVLEGLTDEMIAQRLSIQTKTVKDHVSKLMDKANVITRKDLIVWAMIQGIKKLPNPPDKDKYSLTGVEREIVSLLVQGLSDEQIAQKLSLPQSIFTQHFSDIQRKAGRFTRIGVFEWALTQRIKPPELKPPELKPPELKPPEPTPVTPGPPSPSPAFGCGKMIIYAILGLIIVVYFLPYFSQDSDEGRLPTPRPSPRPSVYETPNPTPYQTPSPSATVYATPTPIVQATPPPIINGQYQSTGIQRVWLEPIFWEGQYYMAVHCHFQVNRGDSGRVLLAAFFWLGDRSPMPSQNGQYMWNNGQASVWETLNVEYDPVTLWADRRLMIPYSAFTRGGGHFATVEIQDAATRRPLAQFTTEGFDVR